SRSVTRPRPSCSRASCRWTKAATCWSSPARPRPRYPACSPAATSWTTFTARRSPPPARGAWPRSMPSGFSPRGLSRKATRWRLQPDRSARLRSPSGGAHVDEEFLDLALEHAGLLLELGRRGQQLARRRAGAERGLAQLADVGGDVLGIARGEVDRAREVLTGNRLLVDRRGDRHRGRLELLDLARDRAERLDAGRGGLLDRADLPGDFLGRLSGLRRQFLDLGRHDREPSARLAAACRLDRGVEREQVGALGDRRDHLDDVADLARRL